MTNKYWILLEVIFDYHTVQANHKIQWTWTAENETLRKSGWILFIIVFYFTV